jgi:hypothetical protein
MIVEVLSTTVNVLSGKFNEKDKLPIFKFVK